MISSENKNWTTPILITTIVTMMLTTALGYRSLTEFRLARLEPYVHAIAGLAVVERAGRDDALGGGHELAFDRLVVNNFTIVDHVGHIGEGIDQR